MGKILDMLSGAGKRGLSAGRTGWGKSKPVMEAGLGRGKQGLKATRKGMIVGGKKFLTTIPTDLNSRIQLELRMEKEIVNDFKKMWVEAKAERVEVIKLAKGLDLGYKKFKELWNDAQYLERDAAILLAHEKKFEEWRRLSIAKIEEPGESIEFNNEMAKIQAILKRLEMLVGRDSVQLEKDLDKAEEDLKELAQFQNELETVALDRTKIGKAIRNIIGDMNKRINVARKACKRSVKDVKELI